MLKSNCPGLPWQLSGKESVCQCRRYRIHPWAGKISHVAEQLSPCTTSIEPSVFQSPKTATEAQYSRVRVLQQEKQPRCEACSLRLERSPHSYKDPAETKRKDNCTKKLMEMTCWGYFICISAFYLHLCLCACVHANLLQSRPTLCDPVDCSPSGSSVHGISQARILEKVAISSSRGLFPAQGLKLLCL